MYPTKNILTHILFAVCLITCVIVAGIGCDSDTGTGEDNGNGGNADSLLQLANDSLAGLMDEMVNVTFDDPDSSFRPHDVDFTGVHSLYERAFATNPNNDSARFGVAFTALMTFFADDEFNTLWEKFKTLGDTIDISPMAAAPKIALGGSLIADGIPLTPNGFSEIMPDPIRIDRMASALAAVDPAISDIQNVAEIKLLPLVVEARNHLVTIVNHSDFVFELSPAMQGNDGASPIELDRADFRVFLATAYGAEAAIHIFLARNLDVGEYSFEGFAEALGKGSTFLNLNTGDHMTTAKDRILSAESQLEAAIADLITEISADPNQDDDLIKVYPEDQDDLLEVKDSLVSFRACFNGPREIQIVVDEYPTEDTLILTVDISQFFDNPVNNYKDLIPDYTISLDTIFEAHKAYAAAHYSWQAYWDSLESIYGVTYPNDAGAHYYLTGHMPDNTTSQEFYEFIYGYRQAIFGWDDLESWYCWDPTDIWCYHSNHWHDYQNLFENPNQFEMCFEWTANDFASWHFPNPSFNGLLPGVDSDSLKSLLDLTADDFQKLNCDTTDINW